MKKLMTMLAAVATAFGLYAADAGFVSGTNFNGFAEGAFTSSQTEEPGLWSFPGGDSNKSEIVTATWTRSGSTFKPAQFADDPAGRCLKVATTLGGPICRNCEAAIVSEECSYIDFNAEFTVFDYGDDPTVGSDAKFALWLQLNEAETATNVFLKAGKVGGPATTYDCGSVTKYDLADWNRVTIKAIPNIGDNKPGFVAFLNGKVLNVATGYAIGMQKADVAPKAQKWFDVCALFPSLLDQPSIIGIGFDGQGWVDNLAFTMTPLDFAEDDAVATVAWDPTKVTGISSNGVQWIETSPANINLADFGFVEGQGYKVYYKATESYVDGVAYVNDNGNINIGTDVTVTKAAASFDGKGYAALTGDGSALAAAAAETTAGEHVLKLYEAVNAGFTLANANAGVVLVLDINGQDINCGAGQLEGAFKLVNTAEGTGSINGMVMATIEIATEKVQFSYGDNLAEDQVSCGIAYTMSEDLAEKALVANAEVSPTYWVVGDKPAEIFTVTVNAQNATLYTNDSPVVGSSFAAEKGTTFTLTATAAEDYKDATIKIGDKVVDSLTVAGDVRIDVSATQCQYATAPTARTGLVYTAAKQTGVEGGTGWEAVSDTEGTDAKGYTAIVKLAAGYDGWTDAKSSTENKPIAWSIGKANPTLTGPAEPLEIDKGAKLSTITITDLGCTATGVTSETVTGTFAWAEPDTAVNDDGIFQANFISTDGNYNNGTVGVSVKVKAAAPVDPTRADDYNKWAADKDPTQLAALTDDQKIEAFLLDCNPTEKAIEDAKKEFKIASITQDAEGEWVVTVVEQNPTDKGPMYKNGYVEIVEYTDITVTGGKLYKAELRQTPVE